MNELKILLLDTEWTYALAYVFPDWKPQYVSPKNFLRHQTCVCAAWKWHHEASTYSIAVTDCPSHTIKNQRGERLIALTLHRLMSEADIIVAHNGDKFDIKMLNTLFIKYGLGPIPDKKSIDTLKVARKYFSFAGNDLDSLAKRFGGKGKKDKPDWFKLTDGDPDEINKSARYCKNDVDELEVVFIAVRPFIKNYPTLRNKRLPITECECCQSKRLRDKGLDWDGSRQYRRIKCIECGHNHKVKP